MDKQREMFEAEFHLFDLRTEQDEDGDLMYFDDLTQGAWLGWKAAIAAQWRPIDTIPVKQLLATREMFIVRGFGVEGVSIMPYTTDAYAVWLESDCGCHYKFARWKHNFQPTHWMPLPPEPTK